MKKKNKLFENMNLDLIQSIYALIVSVYSNITFEQYAFFSSNIFP